MAIHLPERTYLTFPELVRRWQCDLNDIKSLVIAGKLVPSIFVDRQLTVALWDWEPYGKDFKLMVSAAQHAFDDSGDVVVNVSRWLFLRAPWETGPYRCNFSLYCDDATVKPKEGLNYESWYLTSEVVSLDEVVSDGVFMRTEVARFEAAMTSEQSGPVQGERTDSPRKQAADARLIGGLLDLLLGTSPGGQHHSIFRTQADVIEALVIRFSQLDGMSKRTMEAKFSLARRHLLEDAK